jgi:thiol-disulfide isomerase/thioredoxin
MLLMRFITRPVNYFVLLILILISFSFFQSTASAAGAPTFAQPGNGGTPDQQLSACVQIAKQGDVSRALEMAQQVKAMFGAQRMFSVSYMNTLLTIVDQKGSDFDNVIINEIIKVVNEERQTKQYDGQLDPEISFYFMQALGRLSAATMSVNERVSAKIRIYEGQIAGNLKANPGYPRNALEALALPMVSMAQGYAIRHNQEQAFASLGKAVDVGFGDFDMILKDPLINRLENHGAIEELVGDLKVRYKRAVADWSRTVLAEFQRYQFNFDVADIEGGRLRNADFGGKIIVLDMWATWCPPCRKGIPHYIELQKNYGSQGVAVFGVSMDNPQDPNSALTTVKDFVDAQKLNYPCALGDQSFARQVPGKQVLPTTIFIDQYSNVRYIARGFHDYAKIEAITKALASESQPVQAGMPSYSN